MSLWSAIVIVEDELNDFLHYLEVITDVFASLKCRCELVVVANGVGKFVEHEFEAVGDLVSTVTLVELSQKATFATCMGAALDTTDAQALLVTGSYQKISRESMLDLIQSLDAPTDLVVPRRCNRVDPGVNQLQSSFFNTVVRVITKTPFHDLNCNVRAVRRKVLEELELYGDMYRFLPILALERGFRVREIDCEHHQEHGKVGFMGYREYAARLIDIALLFFRSGHSRKPLRFFGAKGVLFAGAGVFVLAAVSFGRVAGQTALGNNPWVILGLMLILLGVQISGIGLVGEILVFTYGRHKKDYIIEETLGGITASDTVRVPEDQTFGAELHLP